MAHDNSGAMRRGPASYRGSIASGAAAWLAALLFACAAGRASVTPSASRTLSAGSWGGPHVALVVTSSGARVEFDCAHATIEEAFRVAPDGTFRLRGRYARERPGPARQEEDTGSAAEFTGDVSGDSMTMRIEVEGAAEDLPAFRLTRGAPGRIVKCQ